MHVILLSVLPAMAQEGPSPDIPHPVGLLQVWGTLYDMDQDKQADASGIGDAEDDPGVKVKQLKVGLADSNGPLLYRITVGISAPYDGYNHGEQSVQVEDAVMGYQIAPWFTLQAGRAKLPFSRDQLMSTADLTFQERGLGSEYVVPDRQLGVLGTGLFGPAKVQLGLFNAGGDLFGDDHPGKTVVARGEASFGERDTYAFWGGPGKGPSVGFGASGLMSDEVSTRTFAAGADVLFRVRGLAMLVDGAWEQESPMRSEIDTPGVLSPTTRLALTSQLSYSLGIVEPSIRFTMLNDSALGNYQQGMAGVVLHGGTNLAGYDKFRLGVGYVLRLEEQKIPNDTVRMWAQVRI